MSFQTAALSSAALALSIAAPLLAQLPAHHAVVGTFSDPRTPITISGTTGIYFVPLPTTAMAPSAKRFGRSFTISNQMFIYFFGVYPLGVCILPLLG